MNQVVTRNFNDHDSGWICLHCGHQERLPQATCPSCKKPEDPFLGRMVAQTYRLTRKLAQGGMGSVYEAEHIRLKHKNKRAVKLITDRALHEPIARQRFLREIEITHLVSQETDHVVHIHDAYGFEDGVGYYVMELLEGETLADRIQKNPASLALGWIRNTLLQICEAMEIVHKHGLIHRDLKPQNIFLAEKNHSDFVKIVDFGIAKSLEAVTQLTLSASVIGTPLYMAPEQIQSNSGESLASRCDIYSLGIIAYEMIAGRTPFLLQLDASPMALHSLLIAHLTETPPSLQTFHPGLPASWEALILRMLEKDPRARPSSMKEIAQSLRQLRFSDVEDDLPTGDCCSEPQTPASFRSEKPASAPSSLPHSLETPAPLLPSALPAPLPRHPNPPLADTPLPASEERVSLPFADTLSPSTLLTSPLTTHDSVSLPFADTLSPSASSPFSASERHVPEPAPPLSVPSLELPVSSSSRLLSAAGTVFFSLLLLGLGFLFFKPASPPSTPTPPTPPRKRPSPPQASVPTTRDLPSPQEPSSFLPKSRSVPSEDSATPRPSEVSAASRSLPSTRSEGSSSASKPPSPSVRWRSIHVELPAGYRLAPASGSSNVQIKQGGRLLLFRGTTPARLRLLRLDGQHLHVHPCTFAVDPKRPSLRLKPLASSDDFKPDTEEYCLLP